MNREMDMAEVSDGKLYGLDDMVKADCAAMPAVPGWEPPWFSILLTRTA
jgi:hypothetical protein